MYRRTDLRLMAEGICIILSYEKNQLDMIFIADFVIVYHFQRADLNTGLTPCLQAVHVFNGAVQSSLPAPFIEFQLGFLIPAQ